jgi:hypothetical protein
MAFTRTKIPDFELANPLYAATSVRFVTVDGSGNPTSTLATLYQASVGIETAANPQILDSEGKFQRPVYIEVPVIGRVIGIHVADHDTGIILPAIDGTPLDESNEARAASAAFMAEAARQARKAAASAASAALNDPQSSNFILATQIYGQRF